MPAIPHTSMKDLSGCVKDNRSNCTYLRPLLNCYRACGVRRHVRQLSEMDRNKITTRQQMETELCFLKILTSILFLVLLLLFWCSCHNKTPCYDTQRSQKRTQKKKREPPMDERWWYSRNEQNYFFFYLWGNSLTLHHRWRRQEFLVDSKICSCLLCVKSIKSVWRARILCIP